MSMLLSGLFSQHAQGPEFHIESQYSFQINQVRHRSGALAYSCNLSPLKAEAEGLLLVQSQPGLHDGFQASLCCRVRTQLIY